MLALGSVNKLLPIPGVNEHVHGFRGIFEALYLRDHMTRQMELAGHCCIERFGPPDLLHPLALKRRSMPSDVRLLGFTRDRGVVPPCLLHGKTLVASMQQCRASSCEL